MGDELTTVEATTKLTALVGPEERFKALVESTFRSAAGDMIVSELGQFTLSTFLDGFSGGSLVTRTILSSWVQHYDLESQFAEEQMEDTHMPMQQHRSTSYLVGENKTRSPSDTAASKGEGMIGISALPTFYFDPTPDGRIKDGLIPDETMMNYDRFPRGRFHLSLAKVMEKAPLNPFTIQKEFGNALKRAYTGFVRMQNDQLQPLPGSIASRTGMTQLDGWFYCVVHGRDIVVGDIEFKANHYSPAEGIPQAFTYSISIALNLHRLGLDSSKVIVPVLVATGTLVQFGCVYMQESLPLPLTLSNVVDTCTVKGRQLAHAYMLKIQQQVELLKSELEKLESRRIYDDGFEDFPSALPIPDSVFPKLNYISAGWVLDDTESSVRHMFETLERLSDTSAWKYVCAPLGFSTRTFDSNQPLVLKGALLFENLEKLGFSNFPPPYEKADEYVNLLEGAASAFHSQNVVHGDLYPSNVFWRKEEGSPMEMRIIDWDTSFAKNEFIPDHIQEMWSESLKWMWYETEGRTAASLDEFMTSSFRFASKIESIWNSLLPPNDCNDSFRKIQKYYFDSTKASS